MTRQRQWAADTVAHLERQQAARGRLDRDETRTLREARIMADIESRAKGIHDAQEALVEALVTSPLAEWLWSHRRVLLAALIGALALSLWATWPP